MCGIFGVLKLGTAGVDIQHLQNAVNIIRHRGPDDEGYALIDTGTGTMQECFGDTSQIKKGSHILSAAGNTFDLALGFRRLSILDLSPNGHQPFTNEDKSVCLIFNGEIYNYIEIREELIAKGYKFRTTTDTEVILNSYLEWGTDCLQKFNGMWAIALYDVKRELLFCSRDRFGVKPFYYYLDDKYFVFASEMKSIIEYFKSDQTFVKKLNEDIVYDYLVNNFVDHTEKTFITGINHLPPSHFIKFDKKRPRIEKYFSLEVNKELGNYDSCKFDKLNKNYAELIYDAVNLTLVSD